MDDTAARQWPGESSWAVYILTWNRFVALQCAYHHADTHSCGAHRIQADSDARNGVCVGGVERAKVAIIVNSDIVLVKVERSDWGTGVVWVLETMLSEPLGTCLFYMQYIGQKRLCLFVNGWSRGSSTRWWQGPDRPFPASSTTLSSYARVSYGIRKRARYRNMRKKMSVAPQQRSAIPPL